MERCAAIDDGLRRNLLGERSTNPTFDRPPSRSARIDSLLARSLPRPAHPALHWGRAWPLRGRSLPAPLAGIFGLEKPTSFPLSNVTHLTSNFPARFRAVRSRWHPATADIKRRTSYSACLRRSWRGLSLERPRGSDGRGTSFASAGFHAPAGRGSCRQGCFAGGRHSTNAKRSRPRRRRLHRRCNRNMTA